MGIRALTQDLLGIDPSELSRLSRMSGRFLYGSPSIPFGSSPRRLRAGTGLELLDRTGYVSGQDPRLIDWRASARSPDIIARRYQDEALYDVHLCLDASASMGLDGGGEKWLLARRVTLALAYLLVESGNRVGLIEFSKGLDRIVPPGRGRGSLARIIAALADPNHLPNGKSSRLAACAQRMATGSSAFVVSDFLARDAFRHDLDQVQHRGCRVQAIQILSPVETRVGAGDEVMLRDIETGERRRLHVDAAVSNAANRRLADHRQQLRDHCRDRGIPLTQCVSSETWLAIIVSHLRALEHFHA